MRPTWCETISHTRNNSAATFDFGKARRRSAKSSTPTSIQQFDEERAENYDDRIRRIAPGYDVLHEFITSVLEASLEDDARILVVGAGTGAEIAAMGEVQHDWHFTAVDPSSEMLERCRDRVASTALESRVDYLPKSVEEMSASRQFDAATSIFVSHFLQSRSAKRSFFGAIADQLRPGAPLVCADLYDSGDGANRQWSAWKKWFARTGASATDMDRVFSKIETEISFTSERNLAEILASAGFDECIHFYQSFLWGAWWTRVIGNVENGENDDDNHRL